VESRFNVLLNFVYPELVEWARRIKKRAAITIAAGLILPLFLATPLLNTQTDVAYAASVGELQGQLNGLNGRIDALKNGLAQKRNEKASLENQIAIFNGQIEQLELQIQATEAEIAKTQLEIAETTQKIKETEAELKRQQEIIKEHLRVIYEEGRVTAVEVVVSSNDFSEFINKTEYLQTMQQKVQETAERIRELRIELDEKKKSLETKKSDLNNLKGELNARKADLDAQKAQKDALLAKTKGEEASFAAQLNETRAAFSAVQSRISQIIAQQQAPKAPSYGALPSYGSVKRGQVIGYQGNTGYSFGSHLHFGLYRGSQDIDPMPYLNNGTLSWPLTNPTITQGYWGTFSHRGVGWPGGIDMTQYFGAPVRAAADGNIIFNGFDGATFGHYIIMDHGNGLRTLYAHMQ